MSKKKFVSALMSAKAPKGPLFSNYVGSGDHHTPIFFCLSVYVDMWREGVLKRGGRGGGSEPNHCVQ